MKKGFTLIELLAVIVILAIIAVIAVPIVLNIIDESKNETGLRSAEMYVKAAELSIANSTLKDINITDGTYNIANGDICLEAYDSTTKKCIDSIDEGTDIGILKVEVNGKVPTSGNITITNGTISQVELNFKDQNTIVKNSDGDLVYQTGEKVKTIDDICTHDTTNGIAPKTAGAKYTCEVKEGTSYTFYVLNSTSTEVNLIMDRNICEDGSLATATNTCYVPWNSNGSNASGPVDAMSYLQEATSTWENIDNLNITYDDEGKNFTGFVLNGKARLPYLSEAVDNNGTNSYLRDNLACEDYTAEEGPYMCVDGVSHIENIYGYWTLSSREGGSSGAWYVDYGGYVYGNDVQTDNYCGVRPVITLKI